MGYSFLLTQTFLFQDADLHGEQPISLPWKGLQRTVGEVSCPRSAEHPVRQTIVLHSVCVYVCVSVFGVGLGALPELRESFFHPTTCRLPAGIADKSKTLNSCQIKRRKENAGHQLVKIEGKTNTFPWTLERKIHNKLANDWNGRVTVNYFQRNHISVFYDVWGIYVCK